MDARAFETRPRHMDLLIQHCVWLARLERPRRPARDRLVLLLGAELALLLAAALAGDHRTSGRLIGD